VTGATPVWEEAVRGGYPPQGLIALSGRERMEAWRRGLSLPPPLTYLTGARPTAFGAGTADAEMPASGWLASSTGVITGGTLAIVADIAFGCSIESELPAATPYTTAELSLSMLRPARPGGTLRASGQAIHVGRSVALSETFILDGDELLAHGTSRLNVFDPLTDPPPPPEDLEPQAEPEHETPHPYLRPPPDGVIGQGTWRELPGIEILERQLAGDLPPPPIHGLTGIRPTAVRDGEATVAMPASEWLASPTGLLQGGTIAMLADFAMLIAVETTRAPDIAFAGLDLKVNFLRPCVADGRELTARAEIMHRGRTIVITRAEVSNADGKPVAIVPGSSMYLPGRPADLGSAELGGAGPADAQ
jgi:uncharacterized protein (TIGR00369 family)